MITAAGELERRALDGVRSNVAAGHLPGYAATLNLPLDAFRRLARSIAWEPGPEAWSARPVEAAPASADVELLVGMIEAHGRDGDPLTTAVARAVACASFGARHLWQDLGMSGRAEVTALLQRHVPTLAAGNTADLKWKRYLFLRLGMERGVDELRPPRCDGCGDQGLCYGPAAAATIALLRSDPAARR